MEKETIITPEEEVKETKVEEITKTTDEVEEEKSETIESLLNKEEEKDDRVPLKTFLETKKEKKSLEKEISSLKEQIKQGATKAEISSDLKGIAEKYDVDANFLEELSTIIYSKAKSEADEVLSSKLKPLEAREKAERIEKIFSENFNKVMEDMPEYKDVVNRNVIKELSLLPQNAKKTFYQIVEETYGNTVTGKKTMETSTPRGGKETSYDESRMASDPKYFAEIMANPELKKKYNDGLMDRLKL
jgi:hypothetical protein